MAQEPRGRPKPSQGPFMYAYCVQPAVPPAASSAELNRKAQRTGNCIVSAVLQGVGSRGGGDIGSRLGTRGSPFW